MQIIRLCSAPLRLCARNEFKAARRDAERIGEKGISNSQQGISNFQGAWVDTSFFDRESTWAKKNLAETSMTFPRYLLADVDGVVDRIWTGFRNGKWGHGKWGQEEIRCISYFLPASPCLPIFFKPTTQNLFPLCSGT
jgi:hypothetical protein